MAPTKANGHDGLPTGNASQSSVDLLSPNNAYYDDVRMETAKGFTAGARDVRMATAKGYTYEDAAMDTARGGTTMKQAGLQLWERELLESSEVKRKATVAQLC